MSMKRLFWIVWMAVMAYPVGAQKKKELNTLVNVNYCLPKVVYQVEVTLECTRFVPGPYRNYAVKELGVQPEGMEPREEWKIVRLDVKPRYLPDQQAVYSVSSAGSYHPVMLAWSAEGFLAGVAGGEGGVFNGREEAEYVGEQLPEASVIDIMKLDTYNHLKEVLDTNYTFQEVDGVVKKIWDPVVRYAPKTEEDNVKEAVSEIFRIRSERVKLLGSENQVPDGKSLEIILKEFDRMEENYLELFLGKKETGTVKRVFECVPGKANEAAVIFRFDERSGISDVGNVSAQPYLLKFADVAVPASHPVAEETEGAAIYYRIPAVGDLKIIRGKEELLSFRTIIPQFGEIKRFPVDVIENEGLVLEFYPQFGALKKVSRR